MKLTKLFGEFLANTVNLNDTRITLLENSVEALKTFVRGTDWAPKIIRFEEQGSWAHQTIIRPVDGGEFDADLLIMVEPVKGWSAADYVASLGKIFKDDATYSDKTKVWDYCVTITYAGLRKIDLTPCVVGRQASGQQEVCNRLTDTFQRSEPTTFTEWLKERNSYSGSNSFRKVTRLLKYLRDIKTRFSCPSVLLTTLIGYRIEWMDKDKDEFSDTPSALQAIVGRLDDWLQDREAKPKVLNPKLASEDFAAAWDQTQYANFRNFIHKYRGWIDEAMEAPTRAESIEKWRKVFGDEFAKGEDTEVKKSGALVELTKALMLSTAEHKDELVEWVREFGVTILPPAFRTALHMQQPPWTKAAVISPQVYISANWSKSKDDNLRRHVVDGEVLKARGGLWFDVTVNEGVPLPQGFFVRWRITNTGAVAMQKKQGRGGFETPQQGNRRWEGLQYRGVHMAEAFVIRSSDNILVGQSKPFHVVIE